MEDWEIKNEILDDCDRQQVNNSMDSEIIIENQYFKSYNYEKIKLDKALKVKDEIFLENIEIDDRKIKNERGDCSSGKLNERPENSNMKIEDIQENQEHFDSYNYYENIKVENELNTELIIKHEIFGESVFKSKICIEDNLSCDICNKTFIRQSYLVKHKIVHSKEKPFSCDFCNKTFKYKNVLNIHKRTHSGEKPFHCNICNKTFTQSYNLVKHKRTHSGEKPFSCDMCNRTFTDRSNLIRHNRIHSV